MADDFPKTLSKAAGVPNTFLKRKLRLDSLEFSQDTLMLYEPCGDIIICVLFLGLARFAIACQKRLGISVLWISDKKRKEQLITSTFDFNGGEPGQEIEKGVFQVDYAPFDYLLPKVSLVVCHGGAGTVFRAIGSGVPVVICPVITPIIADQMLHAQWAERKGFGAFLRPLEPTIQECEEALQKALACKGTCDAAAAKVKQEDGAKAAAAAIEQLAEKDDTKPQSGCCAGICKLFRRRPSGQP